VKFSYKGDFKCHCVYMVYHMDGMSLIKKTQRSSWLSLRPCNTSEMTLGRVLGIDLGILFDYEDHGREDRQSFESATAEELFWT
jgi:hypothetical protein